MEQPPESSPSAEIDRPVNRGGNRWPDIAIKQKRLLRSFGRSMFDKNKAPLMSYRLR